MFICKQIAQLVALRKESVDRNNDITQKRKINPVALRKESVDRNYIIKITDNRPAASLSARRAWIEIASNREKKKHPDCRSPQGERG